jgi:hypothetical protein
MMGMGVRVCVCEIGMEIVMVWFVERGRTKFGTLTMGNGMGWG